jgi:hypothetical protein
VHPVASDIPANGYFVNLDNLETQKYLDEICEWTASNKMQLNTKKTKAMLFNFTTKHQFSTRVAVENDTMEIVKEAKLLGVIINDQLTWSPNTESLVKRANSRMRLLHKLVDFSVPEEDLVTIYILYIRSLLEQSCQVWHSGLTLENITDLERVKKTACKVILQENLLNMESLYDRRQKLCLKFAQKCTKTRQVRDIFPLNPSGYNLETRSRERYHVTMATTGRLKDSAVPFMQRLLNDQQ